MNDSSTTTASGAAQPDLRTVVNFLCGNGMLLGRWFFDGPPAGEKHRYWWRKHLRASFAASTVTASAEALEALKGRISRIGLDIDRALAGQVMEQSPVAGRLKQIAALARAAAPAQSVESVLIDGVAYQTPAPVAAELLGLHLEVRALTALAAEASDASSTARKPLTDEQINAIWLLQANQQTQWDFARAIEAAHGIEP